MKTLKFKPHLAEMIRSGKKVSTWRLFDDKNLQEGDIIGLCENGIEEPFATAKITKMVEKELGSLTDEDWLGHERFASDQEMYETYRTYYGPEGGPQTTVTIIWFDSDAYKRITTETYNQIADGYIERDRQTIDETEEVLSSVNQFASYLPASATVLDVGIGGGRDSRHLAALGIKVVGIDVAEELLEKTSKLENSGLITYLKMDMEALSFPPNSFDGVWANASLHHMPKKNLPNVLKALHDVLKADGYIQIKVHRGTDEGLVEEQKFDQKIVRYFAKYEIDELSQLLIKSGFEIVEATLATQGKWVDICARKV